MIKKILRYIGRSWKDEAAPPPHPLIKIIPPFLIELLGYLIVIVLLLALTKRQGQPHSQQAINKPIESKPQQHPKAIRQSKSIELMQPLTHEQRS